MYNFLCQNVLIFPIHIHIHIYIYIYILFTKTIKTFWSRDLTDIRVLAYFESKIHKDFKTISSLYVLHFGTKCLIKN